MARNLSTAWQFFEMKGFITEKLWIGVTDLLTERNRSRAGWQMSWGSDTDALASDSQFIENNWHNYQPDNGDDKEHCVYYQSGKIYDVSCDYPNVFNFVCEFDSRYAEASVNKEPARTSDDQSVCINIVNSTQSYTKCAEKFVCLFLLLHIIKRFVLGIVKK